MEFTKKKKQNLSRFFKVQKKLQLCKKKTALYEKEIYDLTQLIEISKSLNSLLSLDHLIESITYAIMAQMQTPGCVIFIQKSFDDTVFVLNRTHADIFDSERHLLSVNINHPILQILTERESSVTAQELKDALPNDKTLEILLEFEPLLFVPLKTKNQLVGFLLLSAPMGSRGTYSEYDKKLLFDISKLAAIAIHNSLLIDMTTTDIMTRLKLKHYFFTVISEQLATIPEEVPSTVLMLDIDHFKAINDTYGHTCGDIVLQKVAAAIQTSVRSSDLAARYGGEEFVVFLHNAGKELGMEVAERIRKSVENMKVEYEGVTITVTISVGVAEYDSEHDTLKQLVARADKALYVSKDSGRNRVSFL